MFTLLLSVWRFGSAAASNGTLVREDVPCVSSPIIDFVGNPPRTTGTRVEPASTCADNINLLITHADPDGGAFAAATQTAKDESIAAALRIDNPEKTTSTSVDCVSCHHASRALAGLKGNEFLVAADGDPNRFVPPAGMTTTFAFDRPDIRGNLAFRYGARAFGYFARSPSIVMRTVNESARVADKLERTYLP
jgi:hypothetical protein